MIFPIGDDNVKRGHYPYLSYALIAFNILIFLYELSLESTQGGLSQFILDYGAFPYKIQQGEAMYTLFTSMFLHGGWMHLIGNMLFLWVFADNIEATIGTSRFFVFYFLGGLAAHICHIYFNMGSEIPTVGASGAISAVMGAYLVMFPHSKVKVLFFVFVFRVSAFIFLGIWIWQQWMAGSASLDVSTAESAGVAYWAHVGGFVFGVLAGFYYRTKFRMPALENEPSSSDQPEVYRPRNEEFV